MNTTEYRTNGNFDATNGNKYPKRRAISRKLGVCDSAGTKESLLFHANQLLWIVEHLIHFYSRKGDMILIGFALSFSLDLDHYCNKQPYGSRKVQNKEEIIRTLLGNEWPCLGNEEHQEGMCRNCDDCWHWEGPDSIYETIRNGIQAAENMCAEFAAEDTIPEAQFNHRKRLASQILGEEVK
ncbi:MAG: hypothetical protein GY845_02260 [Planctomycetes bacterium]|nr:hypothetical protein [Planctomycetota bacterium]